MFYDAEQNINCLWWLYESFVYLNKCNSHAKYIRLKLKPVIIYSTVCSVNLKINEIKYTESTCLFWLLSCEVANLTNTLQASLQK